MKRQNLAWGVLSTAAFLSIFSSANAATKDEVIAEIKKNSEMSEERAEVVKSRLEVISKLQSAEARSAVIFRMQSQLKNADVFLSAGEGAMPELLKIKKAALMQSTAGEKALSLVIKGLEGSSEYYKGTPVMRSLVQQLKGSEIASDEAVTDLVSKAEADLKTISSCVIASEEEAKKYIAKLDGETVAETQDVAQPDSAEMVEVSIEDDALSGRGLEASVSVKVVNSAGDGSEEDISIDMKKLSIAKDLKSRNLTDDATELGIEGDQIDLTNESVALLAKYGIKVSIAEGDVKSISGEEAQKVSNIMALAHEAAPEADDSNDNSDDNGQGQSPDDVLKDFMTNFSCEIKAAQE